MRARDHFHFLALGLRFFKFNIKYPECKRLPRDFKLSFLKTNENLHKEKYL